MKAEKAHRWNRTYTTNAECNKICQAREGYTCTCLFQGLAESIFKKHFVSVLQGSRNRHRQRQVRGEEWYDLGERGIWIAEKHTNVKHYPWQYVSMTLLYGYGLTSFDTIEFSKR